MKFNKQVIDFVDHLVFIYAKHDSISGCYQVNINSIPEFDLHELCAIIMFNDNDVAIESTGLDNPWYEKIMLPSLLRHMKDSSDKELQREFQDEWKRGILNYLEDSIQKLIETQCNERLYDEKSINGFHPFKRPDNGEIFWSKTL